MMSFLFSRRLVNYFGASVFIVLAWKLILLAGTAQPIPANDAYGYDGAVVNYLLHGHYCNPSLAIPFPFSGTKIFCIYPPLYQGVLCLWMSVCGTSALSAMWFHFVLFCLYTLILLGIFRHLGTPAWAANLAGLFLFGITFDDRPDGLAQVLGMLAVYAWVRSAGTPKISLSPWTWVSVLGVVLAFCTNPEIGALYFGWIWLLTLGSWELSKQKFPAVPLAVMTVAPVALVALVRYGRPDLWAGFMEHAGQTPSFTNWRRPSVGDLLKLVRTIPAILFVAGILVLRLRDRGYQPWLATFAEGDSRLSLLLISMVMISTGLALASLFLFSANWILILAYVQPLVVGAFLTLEPRQRNFPQRSLMPVFAALIVLVSIRAVGMSTWGVACAVENSYGNSLQIVRKELDRIPAKSMVVMSTAYLYEAANDGQLRFIHEDWTHRADEPTSELNGDTVALLKLKPAALILTQFDFFRRYQIPLAELRGMSDKVSIKTTNFARVPAPDSFPSFHQVLQHISWAPVIVEFSWK
jgi:hypothetical protein